MRVTDNERIRVSAYPELRLCKTSLIEFQDVKPVVIPHLLPITPYFSFSSYKAASFKILETTERSSKVAWRTETGIIYLLINFDKFFGIICDRSF